jgi:hypothetical protein
MRREDSCVPDTPDPLQPSLTTTAGQNPQPQAHPCQYRAFSGALEVGGRPSGGPPERAAAHSGNTPGPPDAQREMEVQADSPADPPPPGQARTVGPGKRGVVPGLRFAGSRPTPARRAASPASPNPSCPAFRPPPESPRVVRSAERVQCHSPRSPELHELPCSPLRLGGVESHHPCSIEHGLLFTGGANPPKPLRNLKETPPDLERGRDPGAANGGVLVTGGCGLLRAGPLPGLAMTPADLASPEVWQTPCPVSGSRQGASRRDLGEGDETYDSQAGDLQVRGPEDVHS